MVSANTVLLRNHSCFDSSFLTGSRWHTDCRCRYPQYNAVRFTFTVLFGLLLSTTFWRVGMHRWAQLSQPTVFCPAVAGCASRVATWLYCPVSLPGFVWKRFSRERICLLATKGYCLTLALDTPLRYELIPAAVPCRSTEKDVLRIIASQYLAALILGFANSATIQPVIAVERPVFYREKAAGAQTVEMPPCGTRHVRPVRQLSGWRFEPAYVAGIMRPVPGETQVAAFALLVCACSEHEGRLAAAQACTQRCRTRWLKARWSCRTSSSSACCTASSRTSSSTSSSAPVRSLPLSSHDRFHRPTRGLAIAVTSAVRRVCMVCCNSST